MPHDAKGNLLKVGDEIILRGVVGWVGEDPANAQYCNLTMELKERMPAYPDQVQKIQSLNAAMVEKQ